MLIAFFVSLWAGAAFAATTSSCANVKKCSTSASAFCSSYLRIPAKTTTVSPAVTVTKTITYSSGTATITKITGTTTTTSTAYDADYIEYNTTITSTSTFTCTSYTFSFQTAGCTFTGKNPNAPTAARRAATSSATRPPCLTAYASGTALSSACKCLSVSTSTSTVTKPTTKAVSKTVSRAKTTSTLKAEVTATTTYTTSYTETLTNRVIVQPTTTIFQSQTDYFILGNGGPSGLLADIVPGGPNGGVGIQFSQSYGPHAAENFLGYYENTPCVLSGEGGGPPYGYIGATGDFVQFSSDPIPADQLLKCRLEVYSAQLFCKHPKGKTYNAGYVDSNSFWHIPINDSLATAKIVGETLQENPSCYG